MVMFMKRSLHLYKGRTTRIYIVTVNFLTTISQSNLDFYINSNSNNSPYLL